jgi:hypothetical protein
MTDHTPEPGRNAGHPDETPVDPGLAELIDQIAVRLAAGESVMAEDYVRLHPEWAEPIQRLMPAIRDLERLGQRVARLRDPVADD